MTEGTPYQHSKGSIEVLPSLANKLSKGNIMNIITSQDEQLITVVGGIAAGDGGCVRPIIIRKGRPLKLPFMLPVPGPVIY